ncbi:hypothetical protein PV04_03164 [Phialophora macrospora]|uniref:Uncharacterized protein n=1 Tax=Phialophora macrospora TaxID=1851006 RepID=A0A0D2D0G4_9EURO|nr:hypothetical protein PV04_03164 [Phialophora macrospora]
MDKSQITKERKSFDVEDVNDRPRGGQDRNDENRPLPRSDFRGEQRRERDQRSLSPYSRRLALTQAMNM